VSPGYIFSVRLFDMISPQTSFTSSTTTFIEKLNEGRPEPYSKEFYKRLFDDILTELSDDNCDPEVIAQALFDSITESIDYHYDAVYRYQLLQHKLFPSTMAKEKELEDKEEKQADNISDDLIDTWTRN
jgi:hypothetical protein